MLIYNLKTLVPSENFAWLTILAHHISFLKNLKVILIHLLNGKVNAL